MDNRCCVALASIAFGLLASYYQDQFVMKKLFLILTLVLASLYAAPSHAQFDGCAPGFCSQPVVACATSSSNTWNPADKTAGMILSNSDKTVTSTAGGNGGVRTVLSNSTGKYYFEITTGTFNGNIFDNDGLAVITAAQVLTTIPQGSNSFFVRNDGLIYIGAASTSKSTNAIASATIGFAIDLTAQRAWVRNSANGNDWIGTTNAPTPNPVTGVDGFDVSGIFGSGVAVFPSMSGDNSSTDVATINQTFVYAIPAGFCAR